MIMVWAKRVSWAVMALAVASGCTKAGRSLVQANVDADTTVNGVLARVEIVVKDEVSGTLIKRQAFAWTATTAAKPTNSFGVFLDSDVKGKVELTAEGFDATSATAIAVSGKQVVDVVAGQTSAAAALHLVAGTPPNPDGGAGGSGAGTGGAGGGSGTGGVGTGGAGGSAAGGSAATGGVGQGGAGGGPGGKPGRAWQGAMLAEKNVLMDDYYPATAVDSKGNIVVAYVHGAAVWSNYFSAATGTWGTEGPIDSTTGGDPGGINVAVDKDGKWLAVWQHRYDATPHGIWQSTSTDGVHWSAPAAIATTGTLFGPVLAMNANGVAAVTWTENIQPNNRYTPEASVRVNGTWSAPRVLMMGLDSSDRNPAVAVTSAGDAIVVWEATPDAATYSSILQATFSAGAWTSAPVRVDSGAKEAFSPAIAANRAGQHVITWIETTSAVAELWARRYGAGTSEAAVKITEGYNITYDPAPSVTLDESGAATAAWAFEIKTKYNAYTSRALWGQAWSPAMAMETDDAATNDKKNEGEWIIWPLVGHDDAGNVVLAWKKRTGTRFDMYARTFEAVVGTWGPATLLETHDTDGTNETSAYSPSLSVGANGVAAVSWYYGWEHDIWANIYR
jgi:hypothetical protein